MKKRKGVLISLLVLAVLCFATAVVGYFIFNGQRRQAIAQRPLVMIHAPLNRDRVAIASGVTLHATARAETGVSRLELWVDNELVATNEAPEGEPVSPLVLVATWEPDVPGTHTVIARAAGEGGVSGQAAIAIEAVAAVAEVGDEDPGGDSDAGDDTGDGAGDDAGGDAGDDAGDDTGGDTGGGASDPSAGDAGDGDGSGDDAGDEDGDDTGGDTGGGADDPPGDDAGDDTGSGDAGGDDDAGAGDAPDDGGSPPQWAVPAPGSAADLLLQLLGRGFDLGDIFPAQETYLHVELLGLETGAAHESLHCYVGVGEIDPRWYPDQDLDQSTDESFAYLGDGAWNVADALSGSAIPLVAWPGDQPFPIDVTCVAMSGSGTDALDLGRLEINARPEAWDGVPRRAICEGQGGAFTVDYRVSQVERLPTEPEKWIDPSVTPPSDLRLIRAGGGDYWLGWEHQPEEGEDPIDGFSVYMNDTLQWIEPADSHFTALPSQWVSPPCGDEYRFTVRAWYDQGCPDCRESDDSNVVTTFTGEPGDPECGQTVIVTFHNLATGDLGGDGRYDPGDMGPVYGHFYVNEELVSFDGRCDRNRCEWGMVHYANYEVDQLLAEHGGAPRQLVVDIPPEDDYVEVGFHIMDADSGRNNEDDLVCEGDVLLDPNIVSEDIIDTDRPLDAPVDRCILVYTLHPVSSAPVVEPGDPAPMPLLRVDDVSVDDASGHLLITVRNAGQAAWPRRDLEVELVRPDGESLGIHTWPELVLEPGERTVLEHPDRIERPLNACVILDPNNRVTERSEGVGWTTRRYCPDLPDLIVTGTEYNPGLDRLSVKVENVGDAPLEERSVSMVITLPDGSTLSDRPVWLPAMTLERWRSATLELHGIGDAERERMFDGYTVTVDAIDTIAEIDEENNDYVVPAGARLRLAWLQFTTRYYPRYSRSDDPQEQIVHSEITVGNRPGYAATYDIGPFEVEREMSSGPWEGMSAGAHIFSIVTDEAEFEIAGDEWLTVFANNTMHYRLSERYLSWGAVALSAEEEWGVGRVISEGEECGVPGWTRYENHALSVQPPEPWQNCGRWELRFTICRIE